MTFKGKIVDKPYPFGLKNITFSSKYVCIVFFLLLFLLFFSYCERFNARAFRVVCIAER